MAYDVKVPVGIYMNLLNTSSTSGYRERVRTIVNNLNTNFNFDLRPEDTSYNDFWDGLINVNNLSYANYSSQFDTIISMAQSLSDTLEKRYMDYIGMVMSLDGYICYASDAFSRIADSIWSFGDGSIYKNKTGKVLPDGSYEIVRQGLEYTYNGILSILQEFEDYISTDPGPTAAAKVYGMSRAKFKDVTYLEWKRDNYFIPKIQQISDLLSKSTEELAKIVTYLGEIDKALNIWLIESFKLVSYINLAFNLSKKVENIANKIITFNTGVTTTSIIAINQAKFWKKQVLADGSNTYQCLVSAIEAGLISLVYPSQLAAFIDDSWDLMIPNYGN